MLKLEADSQEAQEALGGRLCAALDGACIIYLHGDLGTGKTTLVRGFLRALGHRGAVKSPTYTLMEPYQVAGRSVYHFDLYRLSDPGELEYLGIRDLLEQESVLLIEWPEQGAGELPAADLLIDIQYRRDGRTLSFRAPTARGREVLARFGETATPGGAAGNDAV